MADITPIISKPLSPTEISEVLRRSQDDFSVISSLITHDVGRVCLHGNINKWAKYKPIHHTGVVALTEAERKDRRSSGEYDGVVIAQTNLTLESIHNATFEYIRPQGGSTSPYRLSDFLNESQTVGYNHLARPNIVGQIQWSTKYGEGVLDMDGVNNVIVVFTPHTPEETEMDLTDIYQDGGLTDVTQMYPVFVFSTSETNTWAIAMRHKETRLPARIADALNGAGKPYTYFYVDFNSNFPQREIDQADESTSGTQVVITDRRPDGFPTNTPRKIVENVTVSIALLRVYASTASSELFDLSTWTKLEGSVLPARFAIAVPADPAQQAYGLCGMVTTLKMKNADITLDANVSAGSLACYVELVRYFETVTEYNAFVRPDGNEITIFLRATIGDEGTSTLQTKTVTLGGGEYSATIGGVSTSYRCRASTIFTWSLFGITGGLAVGTKVTYSMYAMAEYGGTTERIAEKSDSLTITDNVSSGGGDIGGGDIGGGGGDDTTPSVTVDLRGEWQASSVAVSGYTVYESFSNFNVNNGVASMKVTIKNKPQFVLHINSYAESNWDYTIAWELDTEPAASSPGYTSAGVKAHTRGNQADPANGELAFTPVSYANDGGEHTIWVTYRKDSSQHSNNDKGYVAIPE